MNDNTNERAAHADMAEQASKRERDLQVLRRRVEAMHIDVEAVNAENKRTTKRTDQAIEIFVLMVLGALIGIALINWLSCAEGVLC